MKKHVIHILIYLTIWTPIFLLGKWVGNLCDIRITTSNLPYFILIALTAFATGLLTPWVTKKLKI